MPAKLTAPVVENIEGIMGRHRSLYWTVAANHLLNPVLAHLSFATALLRAATSPADLRSRTAVAAAESALLAGRLLFFDLRRRREAQACFNTALSLALDAGDDSLAAAIFAHQAFVPGFAGDAAGAQDYMREANVHARNGATPNVHAWLAAVESEVYARAGDGSSGMAAIARAEDRYEQQPAAADPAWFDWFDSERLAGFAGYAYLRAGRYTVARDRLESALEVLPATGMKQRAVLLADLAGVEVERPEIDATCELLGHALFSLSTTGYATGLERVREVRQRLEGWRDEPAVRALDEMMFGLALARADGADHDAPSG